MRKDPFTLIIVRASLVGAAMISTSLTPISAKDITELSIASDDAIPIDDEKVVFEADQLIYNQETGDVQAIGNVFLARGGYEVRAGRVLYNEKTGSAMAEGAVEVTLPGGEKVHAPRVQLEEVLRQAFVEDFRLVLKDGAQVGARSGSVDDNTGETILNQAVYSPCLICENDENPPVWQIKAVRVVHDRKTRRLKYKNASLELFGIPVIWTPYLSHPDPTVDRASGFLPVEIRIRDELGVVVEAPYHIVIDESQDLTLKPIITSREGVVLDAEYRQNIGWGHYVVEASATVTDREDLFGDPIGGREFRGHFTTKGELRHGGGWKSRFDFNVASDDTYLRRYNFSNVDTLVSEYALQNFFDQSFLSARLLGFQPLRLEDDQGLTPFALPYLEGEYVAPIKPLGGTWKMGASALAITRFQGLDSRRVSAFTNWRRRIMLPQGIIFTADGLLRGDFYSVDDSSRPDDPAFASADGTTFRGITRLTGEFSWPLMKATGNGKHILEPRVHITLAPASGAPTDLVNEDSRAFELSDLNLFASERAPGLDLIEEGTRISYGLDWTYEGQNWQSNVFVGQAIRLTGSTTQFAEGFGLNGTLSDFVGRIELKYKDWFSLNQRFRLADDLSTTRRNETTIRAGRFYDSYIQLGYFNLHRDLSFINREDREELRAFAAVRINEKWRLTGTAIQDLTGGFDGVEYTGGVEYADECFQFTLQVQRRFTQDRDIKRGTTVLFQIKLRNLG